MERLHSQSFEWPQSIVTIGAFDGVHKGHQSVITYAVNESRKKGIPCLVYTFDPPPRAYFNGVKMLTTLEEKLVRIEALGVDYIKVANFNEEFLKQTSAQFIQTLRNFKPMEIFVGNEFRFGNGREGNVDTLKKLFKVTTLEPVCCEEGVVISSTRIRELVEQGKDFEASNLLGLHFQM
ncbi:FAD synthetase family protein [Rossellomorea aquimaris]|uniref:FAD synthetase family protein n=1 Tax=Rossellomorea aquimaris TaxID=189382 RepID=UPI0007D053C2|nr:FAD synthetase family protein [Rossellomorea aquimaris]